MRHSESFKYALSDINTELLKEFGGDRRKRYVTRGDVHYAFTRDRGKCRFCGRNLTVIGRKPHSVHFTLYIPCKAGGKIDKYNLVSTCKGCKVKHKPPFRIKSRIPNVNTIADLIDRLAVEDHKLAWFENKKREEHGKDNPDVEQIAEWDNLSRDCCELRSMLKREINTAVSEFVATFHYKVVKEARTFRPAPVVEGENTVADLVDEICMNSAERYFENPDKPPEDDGRNEDAKERLGETLMGIAATRQYKIMRVED
jgi:hypothetical protein